MKIYYWPQNDVLLLKKGKWFEAYRAFSKKLNGRCVVNITIPKNFRPQLVEVGEL